MQFERWDDWLIAEHELIERSMEVLKNCLQSLGGEQFDPVQMNRALDFLLEFGDKVHNKKEEDFLFPLLGQRGMPTGGGPIAVMLMEHEQERELIASVLAELAEHPIPGAEARERIKRDGLAYLATRAEHIWKENDVLYAMGRQLMQEGDNEQLLQSFAALNESLYGGDAMEHFTAMVEEVEAGMGGIKSLIHNLDFDEIDAIFETLPVEVTFVDAKDTVAYFNGLDRPKIFPRTRSVVGRRVEKCHPESSVDRVLEIVEGFKNKTLDKADFWIDFRDDKILIRYFPVYNRKGEYKGVIEVTQSIGWIQALEGQKRLLDN